MGWSLRVRGLVCFNQSRRISVPCVFVTPGSLLCGGVKAQPVSSYQDREQERQDVRLLQGMWTSAKELHISESERVRNGN